MVYPDALSTFSVDEERGEPSGLSTRPPRLTSIIQEYVDMQAEPYTPLADAGAGHAGEDILSLPQPTIIPENARECAFQPFITFDFEPADFAERRRENRASRRMSSSSHVSLAHFDPEGVENLCKHLAGASRPSFARGGTASENETYSPDLDSSVEDELPAMELRMHAEHAQRFSSESKQDSQRGPPPVFGVGPDELYKKRAVPPFDLELALKETIKQYDTQHTAPRNLGLAFKDLCIFGLDTSPSSGCAIQPTLGSVLNPLEWMKSLFRMRHQRARRIISGFEGVVNPGEMLLVLGRPGSGCSTLLKALANQTDEFVHVLGERRYDSLTPREVRETRKGDVIYCPEDAVHFPTLTVQQTISFAAKVRASTRDLRTGYLEHITAVLMTIFGLRHVKDTRIGDGNMRGISEGERRRVSICEALAAGALLGCWDDSTCGLDASTAIEFGRALRIATDLAGLATIVSIRQAGDALYQLFDKVCVIGEGRMYYYGRTDAAKEYFINLGYMPHPRQSIADFLVSVTDPDGRIPFSYPSFPIPNSSEEFAHAFHKTVMGQENRSELIGYWQDSINREYPVNIAQDGSHTTRSKRVISLTNQLRVLMLRRCQILWSSWAVTVGELVIYASQAALVGTMYLRMTQSTATFFSRGGIMYYVILFGVLSAVVEAPAAMYRPFAEALALTIVDTPLTIVLHLVFATIVYFLAGMQRTAVQFLTFLAIVSAIALTMKAFFRAVTAAFKSSTGLPIPEPSLVSGLSWLKWIDPLRYGFEAFMTNEFHNLNAPCSQFIPRGSGYGRVSLSNRICSTPGSIAGQASVEGNRYLALVYDYSYNSLWMNLGIIFAFALVFVACFLVFAEWNAYGTKMISVLFKRGFRRQDAINFRRHIRRSLNSPDGAVHEVPLVNVFAWKNIQYGVSGNSGEILLDNISGYVAPGKLVALMGECGSGKTTLLDVLSGRQEGGNLSGEILFNGRPLPSDFYSQIGYCQQNDAHTAEQTVREALLFSAKLRQSTSVPLAEKEAYVESCLKMCGLEAYADAIVGTLGLEHQKRIAIGVELAAQPKLLLFLDEPTSGLDSQAALAIVGLLRDLANLGQAILCTIQQPSGEIFQQFDQLLLLRKGGKMVYFGDIGPDCGTITKYFEGNGARPCGPLTNPADWMMDIVRAENTAFIPIDWSDRWLRSVEVANVRQEIQSLQKKGYEGPTAKPVLASRAKFSASWWHQLQTLIGRGFVVYWRRPYYLLAKFSLNIISGLFIGFTFFKSQDSIQGTQNKLFAIFTVTFVCIPIVIALQAVFIETRRIYEVRERHSYMYSWTALLASQLLVELPWNVISSVLLFSAWYWPIGFEINRAAYTLLMLGLVFPIYYTTLAQAIASICPTAEASSLIFGLVFAFFGTLNGVLQPFDQLGWWRWAYRASPLTYLIEGLVGQALGQQQLKCTATEFFVLDPPAGRTCANYLATFMSGFGGYVANPAATRACQYCVARTTDEFLETRFGVAYAHRWRAVGVVLGASVLNVVLLYVCTYLFRLRTIRLRPRLGLGMLLSFFGRQR
ncbi:hypothetical protein M0805_009439 [Coniferiporia weirii]|nr:hypothetical protein M0805_009439 [Coniferiporia weirii]